MKTVEKIYENGNLTKIKHSYTPWWGILLFIVGFLIGKAFA